MTDALRGGTTPAYEAQCTADLMKIVDLVRGQLTNLQRATLGACTLSLGSYFVSSSCHVPLPVSPNVSDHGAVACSVCFGIPVFCSVLQLLGMPLSV